MYSKILFKRQRCSSEVVLARINTGRSKKPNPFFFSLGNNGIIIVGYSKKAFLFFLALLSITDHTKPPSYIDVSRRLSHDQLITFLPFPLNRKYLKNINSTKRCVSDANVEILISKGCPSINARHLSRTDCPTNGVTGHKMAKCQGFINLNGSSIQGPSQIHIDQNVLGSNHET